MGLEALITSPLGVFYVVVAVSLFAIFEQKFSEKYSILLTFTTIMIAREWWEVPIFIFAWLNLFEHVASGVLSQLFTFAIFYIIVIYLEIKPRQICIPLVTSFLVNFALLFYFNHSEFVGYVARIIGFAAITYILMNAKVVKGK